MNLKRVFVRKMANISFYIFRWINRHIMLKCSYAHIIKDTQYGYMLIYSFHQSIKNIVSLKLIKKNNIFGTVKLPHQVGGSSNKLASTIILLQWMEVLPTQGICKEAPLASRLQPFVRAHSAISKSLTRRRLLNTWRSVQK